MSLALLLGHDTRPFKYFMKENRTSIDIPISLIHDIFECVIQQKGGVMGLNPMMINSGFVTKVSSQFCSYERIAHDDNHQANDKNVIVVFHHAIHRG